MSAQPPPPPPPPAVPPRPPPSRGTRPPQNVAATVISSIGLLIGLCVLVAGLALLLVNALARDDDGYFTIGTGPIAERGYAITTEKLAIGTDADWAFEGAFGTARFSAEPNGSKDLFVGIARAADVDAYLRRVAHGEITEIRNGSAVVAQRVGGPPRGSPGAQDFWLARDQGPGKRSVELDIDGETYAAVAMNADGSKNVATDIDFGIKIGWLVWVGLGLVGVGALIFLPSMIVFIRSVRTPQPKPQ